MGKSNGNPADAKTQIADAKAALLNENQSNDCHASILSINPGAIQRFAVSSRHECYYLQNSDGEDFAVVHSRTATALQTLQCLPPIRVEAVFVGGDPNRPDLKGKKTVFSVSIDVYGSEEIASEVGRRLSKARTYLQHPVCPEKGVPYKNPHYYVIPGARRLEDTHVPSSSGREDQQAQVVDIAKIFVDVEYTRKLRTQIADSNVRTPLLEYDSSAKVNMRG